MSSRVPVLAFLAAAIFCAAPAPAAPSDAVKKLKKLGKQLAPQDGFLELTDQPLAAGLEAMNEVAQQDDAEAAGAILAVMAYPYKSASVEVAMTEAGRDALGGMGSSEAHDAVRAAMKKAVKKQPDLAMSLAEAVGSWKEPASAEALADLLDSKDPRVVMAAARALGSVAVKECVGPLIDAFETWQKRGGEPVNVIGRALYDVTGQGLTLAVDWQKWWKNAEKDWDPSQRDAGGSDGGTSERPKHYQEDGPPPRLFEELEVSSKKVVIVMDVSGSMHIRQYVEEPQGEGGGERAGGADDGKIGLGGPPKLKHGDPNADGYKPKPCTFHQCPFVKGSAPECPSDEKLPFYYSRMARLSRQVAKLIRFFRKDVNFNVVTFSTEARAWKGKKLVAATAGNKDKAIKWVTSLKPAGFTNVTEGLELALQVQGADTIIFVTDGGPTNKAGRPLPEKRQQKLLKRIKKMNRKKNLQIDVVAIAEGHTDFACYLAEENRGDYLVVD